MKKVIVSILLVMALTTTACGSKTPAATNNFNYKVGTASYTHTNDSYGYTEGKNGRGAVSTTLVAAVFDTNGKIVRVSIDEVETTMGIDATGQLTNFTAGEVKSKKELGDSYGMKTYSSIGKEWYQQVESLEKWLEGKTVNSVMGNNNAKMYTMDNSYSTGYTTSDGMNYSNYSNGATTKNSASSSMAGNVMDDINSTIDDLTDGIVNSGSMASSWTDADLKASVTINTAYMQKAIEKAWQNAK